MDLRIPNGTPTAICGRSRRLDGGDMDVSDDGELLVASTYAGFIAMIRMDAGGRRRSRSATACTRKRVGG